MYWFICIGAICMSIAVVGGVLWLIYKISQERYKSRLWQRTNGVISDTPDFIGITGICYEVESVEQVVDLLNVEYACYELLLVIDARSKPELFREIVREFRMVKMDYRPHETDAAMGVRGFYRSQRRGFNRLTMLEQMEVFSSLTSDAAVRAATYDYILPIGGDVRLVPGAVDRLVKEIAEHPFREVQIVRTIIGRSLFLYAREYLMKLGGFDRMVWGEVPPKYRVTLYEPLFLGRQPRYVRPTMQAGMVLLAAGVFFTWMQGLLPVTLILLDMMLLLGAICWFSSIVLMRSGTVRKQAEKAA